MQTNQTQPFTYIVGWTKANIYYVGVKYAKGCEPEDLGATYFTSSKKIRAIWAYIEPDFKCIYPFDTREEALSFEEVLQREFDVLQRKQFANQTIGGKKFGKLGPMSESQKEYLRKINTGKKYPPHSSQTRAKRSKSMTGRKLSEEAKEKLRKINRGKKLSSETREKIRRAGEGRVHSDHSKQKMRKPKSTNHRVKIAANNVARGLQKRKLIQTPIGEFLGRKEAASAIGITERQLDTLMKRQPHLYYYVKKEI